MKKVLLNATLTAALALSTALADPPKAGFSVDFSNCTEFAGVGPVGFANASAVIPAGFSALTTSSSGPATGGIVVRATSCAGVRVNGGPSIPTAISQIGVEIVPPDNTGDINNYTVIYESNNKTLVDAFNDAGVPAVYDPALVYQFTYDSTGKAGVLYAAVSGPGIPAYFLYGNETDPTAPYGDFKANWWFGNADVKVKQASDFPNISFGYAVVTAYTDKNSTFGKLIGGNTDSDFHFLPLRGIYPTAHMVVTATKK